MFKDPITAHGITDALRDAELLARAVLNAAARGGQAQLNALHDYGAPKPTFRAAVRHHRTHRELPLGVNQLRGHLRELSQSMQPEVDALLALDQIPAA